MQPILEKGVACHVMQTRCSQWPGVHRQTRLQQVAPMTPSTFGRCAHVLPHRQTRSGDLPDISEQTSANCSVLAGYGISGGLHAIGRAH